MTSASPHISIVICTRNRAQRLGAMLAALSAIETPLEWEALLVDNASTDETASVLKAAVSANPRLRYLRVDRIGLGAGRDAAWREARGEIIAFTDDDCYVAPDFVDALAQVFEEHPRRRLRRRPHPAARSAGRPCHHRLARRAGGDQSGEIPACGRA